MDGEKTEGAVDKMDCTNILIRGLYIGIYFAHPGLESICNGNVQLNSNLNEISHTFKLASIYYGPSLHIYIIYILWTSRITRSSDERAWISRCSR